MALKENLTRYQLGDVARRFYERGEEEFVGGALEQLAKDAGIEDIAAGFIEGTFASEQGLKAATQTYAMKYQEALGTSSVGELAEYYSTTISTLLDEKYAKKLIEEFGKFSGAKYEDIRKEITKASYVLEGKKKGVYDLTSDQVEEAKAIMQKYKALVTTIETLESIKFENMRPKSTSNTYIRTLKEIADEL